MSRAEDGHAWFEERTQRIWEKHLLPIKDSISSYLEIGVASGHSMRWVMENLEPTVAVGVDPYKGDRMHPQARFDEYRENAKRNLLPYEDKIRLVYTESRSLLPDFFNAVYDPIDGYGDLVDAGSVPNSFDLVYVDGSHDGYDALLDMLLAYHMLSQPGIRDLDIGAVDKRKGMTPLLTSVGGVMVVDDTQRTYGLKGKPSVKVAVQSFEPIMHGRVWREWEYGNQVGYVRLS